VRLGVAEPCGSSGFGRPEAALLLSEVCGRSQILNLSIDAGGGPWAAVIAGGLPKFARCTFAAGGVSLRGGAATLACCSVQRSDGNGIVVESACSLAARVPTLRGCRISTARVDGISLESVASISDCTIEGCGRHGVRVALGVPVSESQLACANRVSGNSRRCAGSDIHVEEALLLDLFDAEW